MIILPAIDIRMGKVVRLLQGDFTKETVYSGDPVNVAKRLERDGARMLHVVDLDGAFLGKLKNLPIIREITSSIKIPIELGGGLRTEGEVEQVLSCGVKRVVIGTRAYADESFLKKLIKKYADVVVVSIDAARGEIISEGWKRQTSIKAKELIQRVNDIGIKTIIYTDILKDGTMEGPNLNIIEDVLNRASCNVIISGGISSLDDIKSIKALNRRNLLGIIVGKALYEGKFTLQEANEIAGEE
ncbi:MAG: 1-(5-phosphoribosyl)-5-[(5-phosphoribosylamino)methylideneamino]imidazole-4-carboxamide isomerase [Candidatus Omnitrophota bacterium]|nr:MAG: 1-(5-phosphoribosyl)-5-[(5-phosphoribosylamino)methylideneamino]imidazole-4-carboxamide isomerase [Candidatus Omnitrophota bacterium]